MFNAILIAPLLRAIIGKASSWAHERTYIIRKSETLVRISQPDRNCDAARRVNPEKGRGPRLWNQSCNRGFPCSH